MKQIILLLIISISINGCKRGDDPTIAQECGDETLSDFTIYNAFDFFTSDTTLSFGNNFVTYIYSYTTENGYSVFKLTTDFSTLCTFEPPLISSTLLLTSADDNFIDSLFVFEVGGQTVVFPIQNLGEFHNCDEYYVWQDEGNGKNTLTYQYQVSIPSTGSWSGDSAYFFGNLEMMSLTMNGVLPKE
ncbi:MAG: hypothetical protein ACHQFW_07395 [Chitinophagales bacterium]